MIRINFIEKFFVAALVILSISVSETLAQRNNQLNQKFALAQQLEKQGEFARALVLYIEVHEAQPTNNSYFTKVRRMLENLKMYDEWIRHINEGLQKKRDDITLLGEFAKANYYQGKEDIAHDTWNSIIELNPGAEFNYRTVSQLQQSVRLYDDAIGTLLLGRKNLNNPLAFANELASIYQYRQEYKLATREYLNMVNVNPGFQKMVEQIINGFPQDSAIVADVTGELEKVVADSSLNANFRRLLSGFYIKNKEYDKAFSSYIHLDSLVKANGAELFGFADQIYKIGIYDYSIDAYNYVLKTFPESKDAGRTRYGLAQSLEKSAGTGSSATKPPGAQDETMLQKALDEYEFITGNFMNSQWAVEAHYRIAEIRFHRLFDLDRAIDSYETVRRLAPQTKLAWDATINIGNCYLTGNDLVKAGEYYKLLETANNRFLSAKLQAQFNLILNEHYSGNISHVKESLEDLFVKTPRNNNLSNDIMDAMLFLDENLTGDTEPLLNYMRAELLIRQRKLSEAESLLMSGLSAAESHPIADNFRYRIAELQRDFGRYDESIESFQILIGLYPESTLAEKAFVAIGDIYADILRDYDRAIARYSLFLLEFPRSIKLGEIREKIRTLQKKNSSARRGLPPSFWGLPLSFRDLHRGMDYYLSFSKTN